MVTQKLFKNAVPTIFRLPTGPTEDSAVLDLDLSSQVLFGDSAVLDLDRSSRMTVIIWLFPLLGHSSRSITAAHHGKKNQRCIKVNTSVQVFQTGYCTFLCSIENTRQGRLDAVMRQTFSNCQAYVKSWDNCLKFFYVTSRWLQAVIKKRRNQMESLWDRVPVWSYPEI
jgi:hypothetical protein